MEVLVIDVLLFFDDDISHIGDDMCVAKQE